MSSFSLYRLVRIVQSGANSRTTAFALGLLIGLAVLSKLSALALLPAAVVTIWFASTRAARARSALSDLALFGAGFVLVTGWWLNRNVVLYNELLGTNTMNLIAGLARWRWLTCLLGDLELPQIERTFWAAFGTGNVHPSTMIVIL